MAAEMCVRFREVLQDQDYPLRWKEITVANGKIKCYTINNVSVLYSFQIGVSNLAFNTV